MILPVAHLRVLKASWSTWRQLGHAAATEAHHVEQRAVLGLKGSVIQKLQACPALKASEIPWKRYAAPLLAPRLHQTAKLPGAGGRQRQQQQLTPCCVLQVELELHGIVYTVSVLVHGEELLVVKIEDKDTLDTWHGEFAAKCEQLLVCCADLSCTAQSKQVGTNSTRRSNCAIVTVQQNQWRAQRHIHNSSGTAPGCCIVQPTKSSTSLPCYW